MAAHRGAWPCWEARGREGEASETTTTTYRKLVGSHIQKITLWNRVGELLPNKITAWISNCIYCLCRMWLLIHGLSWISAISVRTWMSNYIKRQMWLPIHEPVCKGIILHHKYENMSNLSLGNTFSVILYFTFVGIHSWSLTNIHQEPLLLTWFNLNPSMDMLSHPL